MDNLGGTIEIGTSMVPGPLDSENDSSPTFGPPARDTCCGGSCSLRGPVFGLFFLVLTGIDDRKWRHDEKMVETYLSFSGLHKSRHTDTCHHHTLRQSHWHRVFFQDSMVMVSPKHLIHPTLW